MKESLKKYYLMIMNNRQRYGVWMKKAMITGAMAVMVGFFGGMSVANAGSEAEGNVKYKFEDQSGVTKLILLDQNDRRIGEFDVSGRELIDQDTKVTGVKMELSADNQLKVIVTSQPSDPTKAPYDVDYSLDMLMKALGNVAGLNGKTLDTSKIVMFPDVPANHWAYDYVEGLQKAGVLDGYPDGNFSGDRSCTRYEFAAMLFKAMKAGQVIPEQLAEEFKDELGRFRVDRVAGADASRNKIERVRVNGGVDRDHYGTKLVVASK